MTIGILGIGGVGGYFGGLLAAHYHQSADVRIVFIARPATAEIIRRAGLRLIMPDGERIVHPTKVASDAAEAGLLEVLLCTTKSYDLQDALEPLASCITADTLILPLLNGVSAADTIRNLYPQSRVLEGCVYVNAKRIAPGVVEKTGSIETIFFGSTTLPTEAMVPLQRIFVDAGIHARLSMDIETDVWTKAIFTAGMATSTSFFDESIGEVLHNPAHRETLVSLIREAHAVAIAQGVALPAGVVEATVERMETLPFSGTSSMHRDFQQGGKTEYRSLTKHIADLGDILGIDTPTFDAIVPILAVREQSASS